MSRLIVMSLLLIGLMIVASDNSSIDTKSNDTISVVTPTYPAYKGIINLFHYYSFCYLVHVKKVCRLQRNQEYKPNLTDCSLTFLNVEYLITSTYSTAHFANNNLSAYYSQVSTLNGKQSVCDVSRHRVWSGNSACTRTFPSSYRLLVCSSNVNGISFVQIDKESIINVTFL